MQSLREILGKPENLTGQRFGKWTVEERLPSIKKIYASGLKQTVAQYRCICDCGTEKILSTNAIRHSKSCGCRRGEVLRKNREQNLIGKTYGKLIVIKLLGKIRDDGNNYWLCKCECGNYTKVPTSSLNSGNTTSCGCMKRYKPVKYLSTGERFGRLVVSKIVDEDSYENTTYECVCDCGETCLANHKNLIAGHTKSCGCLHIDIAKENIKPISQIKDISGLRFGKLVALNPTKKRLGNSVIWKCKCDCGNITYVSSGNLKEDGGTISCGCASSKGNIKIEKFLKSNKLNYEMEYSFDDLRGLNNGLLRFDACVFNPDGTVHKLIEYDGIFHYEKQYSQDGHEMIIEHDKRKDNYCLEHNISLLRIPYWEFDNIESILKENLQNEIQYAV